MPEYESSILFAQSVNGMVMVPQSDGSDFPLQAAVVVVIEVVEVVVVAKHLPHVKGQTC